MFEANAIFFYFGFAQLALVLAPAFMVAFAALAWLASRGGPRLQHAAAALLGGVAAGVWIHATFVPSPSIMLDGRSLLLPFDDERFGRNLLLCVGLVAAGIVIAWRFPRLTRRFFSALFVVLAAQAAWIAATEGHAWRTMGAAQRLAVLSPDKNVIVILLDEFQADFFGEIVEREPQLARAFDGFTYFANAVAPGPRTILSIPAIHSGVPYREGDGLRDTYRRSVVERSFMAGLVRSGYDAMLVNPILNFCPAGALCEHESAVLHGPLKALAASASLLVDLAVFRIAPDAFKPAIYAGGSWMTRRALAEDHAVVTRRVLELMAGEMRIESSRPVVRFVHLFGTHQPIRVDANCLPTQNLPFVRHTAIAQDRCALAKVGAVLRSLQNKGVYDRTAIAILADHGAALPKDPTSGWIWGASASPLLLVKPFGARGPLARSKRVVGLTDLAASLCAWTADCRVEGGSDLARDTGQPPKYPFFIYYWRHEYWLAQSIPIAARFEVSGPPQETGSWRLQ
jgi:hypothetical protein